MTKDYYRAFITLAEDRSGYSLNGRKAFGKAILETKGRDGKLLVSAQDLKPQVPYKVYLVSENDTQSTATGVFMCNLDVNEKGRGECRLDFDAENVNQTNLSARSFRIAAVIAANEKELIVPLAGYTDDSTAVKKNWKTNFKVYTKNETVIEPNEKAVVKTVEKAVINIVEESAETAIEEAKNEIIIEAITETETETIPPEQEIKAAVAAPEHNMHDNFRNFVRNFKNEVMLDELFYKNTRMSPFIHENPEINWVRISLSDLSLLPFDFQKYIDSPLVTGAYERFKHLVLGKTVIKNQTDSNITKYLLGVPDMYKSDNKQTARELGFEQFKCCEGGAATEKSHGYWLLFI